MKFSNLLYFICIGVASSTLTSTSVTDISKVQYETMMRMNKLANPCWKTALSKMDNQCSDFELQDKQRLALQLTKCHFDDAGRSSSVDQCDANHSVQYCLLSINEDIVFDVYTQFLINVDSICYYLQSGLWQEETQQLIQNLGEAATRLSTDLQQHAEESKNAHLAGEQQRLELVQIIDKVYNVLYALKSIWIHGWLYVVLFIIVIVQLCFNLKSKK